MLCNEREMSIFIPFSLFQDAVDEIESKFQTQLLLLIWWWLLKQNAISPNNPSRFKKRILFDFFYNPKPHAERNAKNISKKESDKTYEKWKRKIICVAFADKNPKKIRWIVKMCLIKKGVYWFIVDESRNQ